MRQRDILNREIKVTAIITESDSGLDLASITDAQSLYDNLVQEKYTGAEKRADFEICVVRDSLESLGGKARWVTHNRNPADCLPRLKGNVECLLKLMVTAPANSWMSKARWTVEKNTANAPVKVTPDQNKLVAKIQ